MTENNMQNINFFTDETDFTSHQADISADDINFVGDFTAIDFDVNQLLIGLAKNSTGVLTVTKFDNTISNIDLTGDFAPATHTHSESDITNLATDLAGKAPTSHTHTKSQISDFPTTMTPSTHSHIKTDITDFPSSMPASDVYAWAKSSTKPTYTASEVGASATGHSHTKNDINDFPTLAVVATSGDYNDLSNKPTTSAVFPSGGIIMWSGTAENIPSGWYLCNGENGTPNLQDRFIVGAGSSYAPGNTGGEERHTLSWNEMPAHSHTLNFRTANDKSATWNFVRRGYDTISDVWGNLTTDNAGAGWAHENRPPYYALCFIMKA